MRCSWRAAGSGGVSLHRRAFLPVGASAAWSSAALPARRLAGAAGGPAARARGRPGPCATRCPPAARGSGRPTATTMRSSPPSRSGCSAPAAAPSTSTPAGPPTSPAPTRRRCTRKSLALQDEGKTADEIVAAFVAKYGEKVLMAPKPEGFNLVGLCRARLVILLVGGVMFAILRQRTRMRGGARGPLPSPAPVGRRRRVPRRRLSARRPRLAEELARLERELKELDQ